MDILLAHFDQDGQPTMIRGIGGAGYPETGLGVEVLPCGPAMLTVATGMPGFPQKTEQPLLPGQAPFTNNTANAIVVYEEDGTLRFSSYWGEFPASNQRYDPSGHVVSTSGWGIGNYLDRNTMRTYNAYQPLPADPIRTSAILSRHYLPLCGEDAIACSFSVPDTIRVDSSRNYLSIERFPLDVTINNPDPARAVFDLQCELRLPPGIVTEPDTVRWLRDVAPMLAPGGSVSTKWNLRVLPGVVVDSILPIVVTTHYRWADHLDNCLSSHSGCRAEIIYIRRDSKRMELLCDLIARDSVRIDSTGELYETNVLPVTMRLRNEGEEAVLPGEAALRVGSRGVRVTPAGDSLRALPRLEPQDEVSVSWQLALDRWGMDRDVGLQAVVRDVAGRLPVNCLTEIRVPGINPLLCMLDAPRRIVEDPGTGYPGFTLDLALENRLDTVLRRLEAEIDLSEAPSLQLGMGEQPGRYLGPIAPGARRGAQWQLVVAAPPRDSSEQRITVWYWYQSDTTRRSCEVLVRLVPATGLPVCTMSGPTLLQAADSVLVPAEATVEFTLENRGPGPVTVERYELHLTAGTGVDSPDALTQPGGVLGAGETTQRSWRLRTRIWHDARTVICGVFALTSTDSVIAACTHTLRIEAVDGLRCQVRTADSVRFRHDPARYEPDPLVVDIDLRNVLDEALSGIEAEIDLTQASRLALAAGESAVKTLGMIGDHQSRMISWLLTPLPGSTDEEQQISIHYRSAQETAWKQCEAAVVIEGWPEEAGLMCSTAGHDSLYSDQYYERFIPHPLHVSYSVTNTGTVRLTGCEATIIPPPAFALAGSDSTQSFTSPEYGNEPDGPVSPGTLLPGRSCTRWWKL
ncbi:MAG: hypothetical protein C0600_11250 [Ignavibacteria bacterium]|nr:MAG: hypothetical protein C0600_11250 [Ignavibacteria bacterium]